MMENRESRRLRERTLLPLPVSVHCWEANDEWVEVSSLIDASPFGARLTLARPTEPGRLLQLTMQMPRHLRCFDHDEDQYSTWALVRHIKQLPLAEKDSPQFAVGVAFVGKRLPPTVGTDPTLRYDIGSEPTDSDLWGVRERARENLNESEERRQSPRYPIITDIVIEVYDSDGRVYQTEQAKTENISARGMAVVSNLNLVRGRYVRLRSSDYNIAVIAAVRRLRRGADGKKHLHLEFIDQQWPQLEDQ